MSSGRTSKSNNAGITLLEMMVVVALIAVMIGVTFPAFASGLESIRLRGASDDIVSALNSALTRANRQQDAAEVVVSLHNRSVTTQTIRTNIFRKTELPEGISIARVLPALDIAPDDASVQPDRHFYLYPDGSVPEIAIDLVNRKGFHRLVSVDPITGVAREQGVAKARESTP